MIVKETIMTSFIFNVFATTNYLIFGKSQTNREKAKGNKVCNHDSGASNFLNMHDCMET